MGEIAQLSEFSIDGFLSDNYKLFTIMSVFGATSFFLTTATVQISDDDITLWGNVGAVSSILLFMLVAYIITQNFFAKYGNVEYLLIDNAPRQKFICALFIGLFNILVFCVGLVALSYSEGFSIVAGFLAFLFAAKVSYTVGRKIRVHPSNLFRLLFYISWSVIILMSLWYVIEVHSYTIDYGVHVDNYPISVLMWAILGSIIGIVFSMSSVVAE